MVTESTMEKLNILTAAAKYDVACTSSGVDRSGGKTGLGNSIGAGICHCFAGDGRCISLLKVLFTNECIYDCKYCINRRSNDVPRASFTPEELADLTISFYRRNYIEGLFLSSGITHSPNHTMELIYRTVLLLRETYRFNGYIHVKAIPGTDEELTTRTGWLADRMSVNLELPTTKSLKELAPHKSRTSILTPMRNIQLKRNSDKQFHGEFYLPDNNTATDPLMLSDSSVNYETHKSTKSVHLSKQNSSEKSIISDNDIITNTAGVVNNPIVNSPVDNTILPVARTNSGIVYTSARMTAGQKRFVPSGQSTQMIIGASNDTDYQIMKVSESLYDRFQLKRVFYQAFMNVNHDSMLPDTSNGPELLREHRLYQADWLLRFYHFNADEILSPEHPSLNTLIDPKCNYALNHLEIFPVEVTTASYHTLLRVPGIGVTSARRIINARKHCPVGMLSFTDLKKLGVVLKRARYFITCSGKSLIPLKITQSFILANLLDLKDKLPADVNASFTKEQTYEQLSLFDVSDIVEQKIETIHNNRSQDNCKTPVTY